MARLRVFISYRRADAGTAGLLDKELRRFFVVDRDKNLDSGVRWRDELKRKVAQADIVVVMIGSRWTSPAHLGNSDDVLVAEVEHAVRCNRRLVPVYVDDVRMETACFSPTLALLKELQSHELRHASFERDVAALAGALQPSRFPSKIQWGPSLPSFSLTRIAASLRRGRQAISAFLPVPKGWWVICAALTPIAWLVIGTLWYAPIVDAALQFAASDQTSTTLYSAPLRLHAGDPVRREDVQDWLARAGYQSDSSKGRYRILGDQLEVRPGATSYFDPEAFVVQFGRGEVTRIVSLRDNAQLTYVRLDPIPLMNWYGGMQTNPGMGGYPRYLIDAVTTAEDVRFFSHTGLNPGHLLGSSVPGKDRPANATPHLTLTQAAARFVVPPRGDGRSLHRDIFGTIQLENRLTKMGIFEIYARKVQLGPTLQPLLGFNDAALAYFAKNVSQLTLAEAALLAAIIRDPDHYDPRSKPDRAKQLRNDLLAEMLALGYIRESEYAASSATPLQLANPFLAWPAVLGEVANDHVSAVDRPESGKAIYSTLDYWLQHKAADAILAAAPQAASGRPKLSIVAVDILTGNVRAAAGNHPVGQRHKPGPLFAPLIRALSVGTKPPGAERSRRVKTDTELPVQGLARILRAYSTPSLARGDQPTSPLELARLYAALVHPEGLHSRPSLNTEVRTGSEQHRSVARPDRPAPLFDPSAAASVLQSLPPSARYVQSSGAAFAICAEAEGTWCAGSEGHLATVVWMEQGDLAVARLIWRRFMDAATDGSPRVAKSPALPRSGSSLSRRLEDVFK